MDQVSIGVSSEKYIYIACDEIMKLMVFNFLLSVIPVILPLYVLPFYLKLSIGKEIVAYHCIQTSIASMKLQNDGALRKIF